ncbi:hypothetical protein H4R20_003337 [Coemansia guatemalensis]|uniref:RPA-interacting protein N-terminal domain-containing protein n=1 Tax=Coemansia guatemalensis TaxID=2761395 RepID=A0A9W8HVG1_9FUNG|nr:hypothetical protein H4R20_003337 [Coemansia guatemalensis]
MNAQSLFSSPPRQAPSEYTMRRISRSGGGSSSAAGRMRRPEYRHLSSSSRAARINEQPWRRRFREQCMDRLSRARDQSFMLHRQLADMSQNKNGPGTYDPAAMQEDTAGGELSEEEIFAIVQQEWARFREEMERESMECGALDAGLIEEIGEDLDWDSGAQDNQMMELAEWEEYENQLLEDEVMEAALMEAEMCLDGDEKGGVDRMSM